MPKISVVLPVYNGEKYLSESIESIINQKFTDWELIIVNDCSTDDTLDIVNKYANIDKRIIVVNNATNQKLPRSLNIGFSHAKGNYLTWTSDDNIYDENAFEKMFCYLEKNKYEVFVCTKMDYITDDIRFFNKTSAEYSNSRLCVGNYVGACFLYRHEVINTIGEYDPDMFLVEDYEYWLRILMHYGNISYIDDVLYHYRRHSQSLSATRKKDVQIMDAKLHGMYMRQICEFMPDKKKLLCRIYYRIVATIGGSDELHDLVMNYVPEIKIVTDEKIKKYVIIYGAGAVGRQYVEDHKENIVAFTDKDEKKVGELINGIRIISLQDMKEQLQTVELVIAAKLENTYSMIKTAHDLGIKKCHICMDYWNI